MSLGREAAPQRDAEKIPEGNFNTMWGEFSEEEQRTLDRDIFNRGDVTPFETTVEIVESEEDASTLKALFELYLAEKGTLDKDELRERIQEIIEFIDSKL